MKNMLMAAAVALLIVPVSAHAGVIVTSVAATNPYSGPTPTYDFSTPAPVTGGSIVNNTVPGQHSRPYGSTGNYWSIGPLDGSPGILNLSNIDRVGSFSFLWGSVDQYNLVQILDSVGNVLYSINGYQMRLMNPIAPNYPPAPNIGDVNRVVTFTFTDVPTQSAVSSIRFSANRNAFELDNLFIRAVPEPATWLTMILGFFGLAFAIRRGKSLGQGRAAIA